jgi:hypothetical protein
MSGARETTTTGNEFYIKDSFLAPWGLASEELPMHLLWRGKFDYVEIRIPEPVEVLEMYNVEEYSEEEIGVRISNEDLVTHGYLSLVLTDSKIYERPAVRHEIDVRFYDSDGDIVEQGQLETHIIRPRINVQKSPDEIELSDESVPDSIEIDMEYVGFGMAQISIEARAEGEFVSEGESFHHDLLRAILDTGVHKQDLDHWDDPPEEWREETEVEVPEEEIGGIVEEMRSVARDADSLHEEYGQKEVLEVANVLEEAETESKTDSDVAAIIYRFIETALVSSILNVVDRHPAENVSLSSTSTKIKTKTRATEMEIKIKLKDNLDNHYEPEIVVIEIDDTRDESAGVFETDIETNWENHQVDPDEVFGSD